MDDVKALYKDIVGSDFPSKDFYGNNKIGGRIGNLYLNPILDRASTLDDVISILYDVVRLIDDLPKNLESLSNIKCDKFDHMVEGLEEWIIKVTK